MDEIVSSREMLLPTDPEQHSSELPEVAEDCTVVEELVESSIPQVRSTDDALESGNVSELPDFTPEIDELRRAKVQLEQTLFETSANFCDVHRKLTKANDLLSSQTVTVEELMRDRSQYITQIRESEAERNKLMLAKKEMEERTELLLQQKEDYDLKIKRLENDKSLLKVNIDSLKEQIKKLFEKNAILENEVAEMQKDKYLIQYEKERWSQEKEIYLSNKDWFINELAEREKQLATLRVEMIKSLSRTKAENLTLIDESDSLRACLNATKLELQERDQTISKQAMRIKEVLEESNSKAIKLEDEILASERLINLYKESSEDAEKQLKETNADLEEKVSLLDKIKEAYNESVKKFYELEKSLEEQLSSKDEVINQLKDELTKADELLKSNCRTLTEGELAEMSPTAAIASRLIKGNVSLTGVYREHCRVVSELEESRVEYKKLEENFRELVEEIERKAPLLAQQRAEYENLELLCKNQCKQIEIYENENQRLISVRDSSLRELAYTRAELERYQRDNEDLSRQARHLLQAVEINRASDGQLTDSPPPSLEDRDFLWASIGELQGVNQKLMSQLREAKTNHEKSVQEANTAEVKHLEDSLKDATEKLTSMEKRNSKQNDIISKLTQQRDSYKAVIEEGKLHPETSQLLDDLNVHKQQLSKLEGQLERTEKFLQLFQEEKKQSDSIQSERLRQYFELNAELRRTNGKLEGDIEIQARSQDDLLRQVKRSENALKKFEEDNTSLKAKLDMREQQILSMQNELMESAEKIAREKSCLTSMSEEVALLRSSESRLSQEIAILRESEYTNKKVFGSIEMLKKQLNFSEASKFEELEKQLVIAKDENETMKRFMADITEQHRIMSSDFKMSINKLKMELDQAVASKKSIEDHLARKEEEMKRLQTKYDELMRQINSPDTASESTLEGVKKEAQQLRNKNNYLESQLKDLRCEYETVEKKLAIKENELAEFAKVSSNMESTLVEQSACTIAEKESLKAMLDISQEQLKENVSNVSELRSLVCKLRENLVEERLRFEEKNLDAEKQLFESEQRFNETKSQLLLIESQLKEAQAQLDTQKEKEKSVKEIKQNLLLEIENMKSVVENREEKIREVDLALAEKINQLEALKKTTSSEIGLLRACKSKLEENLEEMVKKNNEQSANIESLSDNLYRLMDRLSFLERSDPSSSSSAQSTSDTFKTLHNMINHLRVENVKAIERSIESDMRWKHVKARQDVMETERIKMEEEIRQLRIDNETNLREIAEKSELAARLSFLQNLQVENEELKANYEKSMTENKLLEEELEAARVWMSKVEEEKVKDKTTINTLSFDLASSQKETEIWKERHAQSLTAIGDEQTQAKHWSQLHNLQNELELIGEERDSLKEQLKKINADAKIETKDTEALKEELENMRKVQNELRARFEQARDFARKYRSVSQNLGKENADLKRRIEDDAKSNVNFNEEIAKLKEELESTRSEAQKLKLKPSSSAQRSGWPIDITSAPPTTKANVVLQTQMKQIESLNQQNKELKTQLEQLSKKLKEYQERIVELETRIHEFESDNETKEDVRCRFNLISGVLAKKETELKKLREQIDNLNREKEHFNEKTASLQADLEQQMVKKGKGVSTQLTLETANTSASHLSSTSEKLATTSAVAQEKSDEPKDDHSSCEQQDDRRSTQSSTSSSKPIDFKFHPTPGSTATSKPESSLAFSSSKFLNYLSSRSEVEVQKLTPVSTTSESVSWPNVAGSASNEKTVEDSSCKESVDEKDERAAKLYEFSSKVAQQKHSPTLKASLTSTQSNTVSQSTTFFFDSAPLTNVTQSDVGDGTNVISSSGAVGSVQHVSPSTSSDSRKRPFPSSGHQSSCMETDSDPQAPVKRKRESPSEQVSEPGLSVRISMMQIHAVSTSGDSKAEDHENVQTTTTLPEPATQSISAERIDLKSSIHDDRQSDLGEGLDTEIDEGMQDDGDVDEMDDQDDDLSYEGDEEYARLIDEEDFEDEEGFDDEEGAPRVILGEDDIVALDDEEENSQLVADQSTDEADEGMVRRIRHTDDLHVDEAGESDPGSNDEQSDFLNDRQGNDPLRPDNSRMERVQNVDDAGNDMFGSASEKNALASDQMELSQSAEAVSGSGLHASRDSSPFVATNESDSRGASSTLPTLAVVESVTVQRDECDEVDPVVGTDETSKPQTDDEAASSEPSTSNVSGQHRRIRIRMPDIDEPSSSSGPLRRTYGRFGHRLSRGGRFR